ncbi:hypothetical protein [Limnobacter sp.]|uniref:hypothetical protein n=1 Tax=Limnobacter sp. TaxID=2003368 RepID=UPI003510F2AE
MTAQTPGPGPSFEDHAPTPVRPKFVRQLGQGALVMGVFALLVLMFAMWMHVQGHLQKQQHLAHIAAVHAALHQELNTLNQGQTDALAPQALKKLLGFGQFIAREGHSDWFGSLHRQTLQLLLTQSIETLSRPVAGVNTNAQSIAKAEAQLRLDTLPKLAALQQHVEQGQNGLLLVAYGLAILLGLASTALGLNWWSLRKTSALKHRIHLLGRALQTQEAQQNQLAGAHQALQGVLNALNKNQQLEHRTTLMQIGQQLEELRHSGQTVLQFARSFHQLSAQGTQVAKTALNSEQRNQRADSHMEIMQSQLEGLRGDIRSAAQGLRKAGEVSRQLLTRLDDSQMELSLSEPDRNAQLQHLVEQSQQALKEAIEGLVLASQKINMGQHESHRLAEYMAVNQTAWSNLLKQIEHYAEAASTESEQALMLAKRLISSSQPLAAMPKSGTSTPQAAKAPPQLLP